MNKNTIIALLCTFAIISACGVQNATPSASVTPTDEPTPAGNPMCRIPGTYLMLGKSDTLFISDGNGVQIAECTDDQKLIRRNLTSLDEVDQTIAFTTWGQFCLPKDKQTGKYLDIAGSPIQQSCLYTMDNPTQGMASETSCSIEGFVELADIKNGGEKIFIFSEDDILTASVTIERLDDFIQIVDWTKGTHQTFPIEFPASSEYMLRRSYEKDIQLKTRKAELRFELIMCGTHIYITDGLSLITSN